MNKEIRIYVNGFRFDLDDHCIYGKELCELVFVPTDNASIQNESGKEIGLDENIILKHGESFTVMRKIVGAS